MIKHYLAGGMVIGLTLLAGCRQLPPQPVAAVTPPLQQAPLVTLPGAPVPQVPTATVTRVTPPPNQASEGVSYANVPPQSEVPPQPPVPQASPMLQPAAQPLVTVAPAWNP